MVTAETILKSFPDLLDYVEGDLKAAAVKPCSQSNPESQAIVFTAEESFVPALISSDTSVLVVHSKLVQITTTLNCGKKTILRSPNPYLAMALVNSRFFKLPFLASPFGESEIHSTASIAKSVKLGRNVVIGPNVVLDEDVQIGDRTFIGANTVIENQTIIGSEVFIHPLVYIGHSCSVGNNVEIKPHSTIGSDGFGYAHDEKNNHYKIPHYGAVIIEDNVSIGANVNIDRGTFEPAVIGAGTRIDNHCHFGHNCKVGKNCLITAGFIVAGSTTIGDNCVFAGRVSVNGHIRICSNCRIGPMSAVTNHLTVPGDYAGFPVIPFKQSLKAQSSIAELPRLRKNVRRILKHLGLSPEGT